MVNKSKAHSIAQRLSLIALIATGPVLAQQCVLQSKTVTQSSVAIEERTQYSAQIVSVPGGGQRCMASLRGRIGDTWYTGFGEYTWTDVKQADKACTIAQRKAESSIVEQAGSKSVADDQTLICREDPTLDVVQTTRPGSIAELAQYRPHPQFRRDFRYNGTRCRWFLESNWTGHDVRTGQGIICHLRDNKWVVVDKF